MLIKNVGIRDGQRLEVRIEAQNVLNHPVFGDPNTSFGSTSFGQITGTKVGARQMMVGLKYPLLIAPLVLAGQAAACGRSPHAAAP